MFREMRRKNQLLSDGECREILGRGSFGVLAVAGDGGYPYAVPISYAYAAGKLFFHCALTGHKLDAIAREPKASFCVVDRDNVVPAEYTTYYRSVIVFGRAHVLTDDAERRAAMELLAGKYSPGRSDAEQVITDAFSRFCVVEMSVEHMTGKQARELIGQTSSQ